MEDASKDVPATVNHIEHEGHLANQLEHDESAIQTMKRHPKLCLWCIYSLWILILNSFENQASGSVLGIPEFRKDFGSSYDGSYVLPANWQGAFSGGPVASTVIGAMAFAWLSDRFGRKPSYFVAFMFSIAGVTAEVVATTNAVFFAGKFINGFALGGFLSVCFTYISEIVTTSLRGIMMSAVSLSFSFGPFIVALIVKRTGTLESRWAYRAPLASQYGIQAVALAGWFFMPESPWWCVSQGKNEKAKRSLHKLGFSGEVVEQKIAAISLTLEQARHEAAGATFIDCFRGTNLRRTIISIAPLSIQALSGIFFISSYATYYYQLAGYSTRESYILQVIQQVMSMSGNITAWYTIEKIGRRRLAFWGLFINTAILFAIGGLGVNGSPTCLKASCALMLLYCFVANASIGAAAHVILAEVSTARLRNKTLAIGNSLQNLIYLMWSFVLPYLFNPNHANLGAKLAFIFAGLAVISLCYLWVYQVEPKGRTYEELDELFQKKVARKDFATFITEAQLKGENAKQEEEHAVSKMVD